MAAQIMTIHLSKGESPNLGFRLQGGKDFAAPLVIQKVNGGSPADRAGLIAGDAVVKINNTDVFNLRHKDAQDVIIKAGPSFAITVQRGGSTWKPSVTPTGTFPAQTASINNVSPVTKTSLAAQPQPSIGAIGTGHNVAAKPFLNGTTNGAPKLVNKQYNTPVGLYSEESIAETLSAQSEVLSTGVLGVNFKKNEKGYDASKSAVYHMLQEAEKEPREPEPDHLDSGVVTAPLGGLVGLKHVQAPETKPTPPTPQLPPGQNICADCERLIVGVFVRIKDKNLHVECFKCSTCGASLKNVGYYNINNKLYCDIHAKLAARSNPPGANLVPVTVPPGGRAPAGTISAALTSHSFPSPSPQSPKASPLSPSTNFTATPFQTVDDDLPKKVDVNDDPIDIMLLKSLTIAASKKSNANPKDLLINNKTSPCTTTGTLSTPYNTFPKKGVPNFSSAPKPFASVSAPLSPNSYSKPLPKAPVAPALIPAPQAPALTSTPGYFTAKPAGGMHKEKGQIVHNIVWPPVQEEESGLPTASPLYFPPPSQVKLPEPKDFDKDYSELEEVNNYMLTMDPKMSICSSEISHLTGRKSAVECVETIAEHLETQMLVESIMKTRPKTPPPLDVNVIPTRKEIEAQEQAKIEQAKSQQQSGILVASICPCNKSCCNEKCETCPMKEPADLKLPHDYEKKCEGKSKIQNAIPQKWESTMVSALRTTPDRPYCITPDNLSQIPQKHSTTALASALSIAPSEPFNPVGLLYSKDPVPLPEETVPYLPPERPIIPAEPKVKETRPEVAASPFVEALKTAPDRPFTPVGGAPTRKKKPAPDPLLKDLPKSQEKLSMLSALTTASERTYSPFITEFQTMQIKEKEEQVKKEQAWECRKACIKQPQAPKPFISTMVNTFEGDDNRSVQGHFPPVSVELQQSCEESYEQRQSYAHIEERMEHREMKQEMEVQSKSKQFAEVKKEEIARQSEEVIMKKPLNVASQLHKSEYLPQYQTSLEYAEEIQLPHHKNINKLLNPNKPKDPIIKPVTTIMPGQQNPNISQSCFQPVHEDFTPPNSAFSQRVAQPATPSMINKPPSAIPYYQQNLVATEFLAPEVCLYDPKSPAVSRSPSPCPGGQRSVSPFRKSSPRPKSPAPGPPPNPLHVLNTSTATDSFRDIKKEQAKESVTSYIPQHREKLQQIQQHESAGQSVSVAATGTCSNKMQQQYQADHSQMSQLQSYEATQRALAAKSEMSKQMVQANYQQKDYRAQEYLAASAEKHSLSQQGNQTVAISEKSKAEQLQQLNKSEMQSVQTSADNRVQIQRKKTVTEEFEHTHKEKVIEIEKSSTGVKTHPFQKVNAPVVDDQPGIIGLHVTNPHPLVSPFHKTQNIQAPKPPSYQVSKSNVAPASVPPPAPVQKVPPPMPSKINVPIVPPLSGAGPSSANKLNVNPNVPAPSVGSGSGRQTGSVFAPKRGRGVLNVGGMVGARLALCGHCHQQIRGPFITALGKIWCPDHFTCATPSCKRPLQDIGFVEEKGQLHCEYCFEQYLAPNCSKCGIKIKGDCLKAIGRNFHPECFNCTHCGKLFANSPFFLEDGLPYCEADWNEMFTTKCFACGFPVEAGDRWVEALNNNYHSQCFNCTMCKKNLEGQSFFAKGGRPFCKNHAR